MVQLKFILISIFLIVLLQPMQVHARLQIKGRSNTNTNTWATNASFLLYNDRLLKNNDKNGGEKNTPSSKPPPPPPPAPPSSPSSSDKEIKKPTSENNNNNNDNNKPSSSSSKDSISFPFQQFYLTFQILDATSSSLNDIQESKILQVTKRHIDDYFYNMFTVDNIVISVKNLSNSRRKLRRKQQYDHDHRRRWMLDDQQLEATYQISGSIQFQNNKAPTANLMDLISLQLFDDEYISLLEKKGITTDSIKASVSFNNPNENGKDKEVGDGATTSGASNNNNLETIGGGETNNRGGIIGGVLGSFAILCMASLLLVKMQRDNKQGDDQDKSSNGGHSLLTSQIFEKTLRSFNLGSRHNGASSDEEDNTGHDNGLNHKYRKPHHRGLRNNASKTRVEKNTDVMTNDDGSVFETVYSIQGGLDPPVSPSLKRCFSMSPRRMTSPGINSYSGKRRGQDTVSVVGADDTYSLNGAIDEDKPNMGDEMLDHVLSMNDYDSSIIVIDPDSFNDENMQKSGDESVSNHDLGNNNDDDSAEISAADMSTFSFSHHYSDAQSVQSTKRQTIKDLRVAASKRYFSPEKSHIICEGTETSPGIDVVRVSPEKEKPISLVEKATSFFGSLVDGNDNDTSLDSNHFSAFGDDILDNDFQSPAQLEATPSSNHREMEELPKISSRIVETEMTDVTEATETGRNPQTEMFESVEIGPNPLTRTNTSNFVKNRNFKITVETSAPPPPKTPDRYPFQDLNRGKKNSRRNMSAHDYSESESSDDEYYSEDETTFIQNDCYPIQSQRSKENHVPTKTSTSNGQVTHHGNNSQSNSVQQNIIKHQYTRRITTRRDQYKVVDAADARNARRKRLSKSIERNSNKVLNSSKAEKAANLRKTRLQTQKLALSPTQVKKKLERDAMIGRREI